MAIFNLQANTGSRGGGESPDAVRHGAGESAGRRADAPVAPGKQYRRRQASAVDPTRGCRGQRSRGARGPLVGHWIASVFVRLGHGAEAPRPGPGVRLRRRQPSATSSCSMSASSTRSGSISKRWDAEARAPASSAAPRTSPCYLTGVSSFAIPTTSASRYSVPGLERWTSGGTMPASIRSRLCTPMRAAAPFCSPATCHAWLMLSCTSSFWAPTGRISTPSRNRRATTSPPS